MGEAQQQQQQQHTSRLGLLKSTVGGGEIVEVQGGHIVRSTGRKDRHSKVCTAKGPRDRRVRLSAHTAIQFYDVQDRLGYDRPSKAVDWLIKKAKAAIDELAELPPWRPTATNTTTTTSSQPSEQNQDEENQNQTEMGVVGSKRGDGVSSGYAFEQQHQQSLNNNNPNHTSGFLPPSLDSDAIADTIKSFFPIVATTSSSPIHFQNYPPDLLSRSNSQTQDLRLSLQSFQDPILLHHHHHSSQQEPHFPISAPMSFDPSNTSTWSEQQQSEMGRFQRMVAWNAGGGDSGSGSGGGGFVFNSPQLPQPLLGGQNPFFTQRGPLQSSNSPQVRVWNNDPNYQMPALHPSSVSGIGFASGGFSGFRVPARIQGEEEHEPASNKPSSASRH